MTPGSQRVRVVAASYRHAEQWWTMEGRSGRVPYVSDAMQLRGLGEDAEVIFLSGCGQRRDFHEILDVLKLSRVQQTWL